MLIILLIYFLIFLVWAGIAGIAIFQSTKYFEPGSRMRLAEHIFIWACVVILAISLYMIFKIDWTAPISIKI